MVQKLKVYELAKEVGVDSHVLIEVMQRMGIDGKNTMSVLGLEEVRTVREYYRKNKPLPKGAPPKKESVEKPVTEKRVGATVIRRRASAAKAVEAVPEEVVEEVPVEPSEEYEATETEENFETAAQVENETEATQKVSAEGEDAPAAEEVKESTAPVETPEPVVAAKSPEKPAAPVAPEPPPKPRRVYASIIKKVATEQHLSEKVGPKAPIREKKIEKVIPKPAVAKTGAAAGHGPRKVKEVDLTPVVETSPEATRRRLMERQSTVFKTSDYLRRELVHSTKKKKGAMSRPVLKTQITKPAEHKRVVEMAEKITVAEFAKQLNVKAAQVIGKLMNMGVAATINQSIDLDTATLVAQEFQYEVKQKMFKEEDYVPSVDLSPEKMLPRPPVVTIMGHVDHGKTSLLDAIRKTKVASGEAGGITQHIGAYQVDHAKGKITFIDTPGHEAFTAMRARGAKVTDIVILVVSAIDGVMPQTLESVAHAKAAGVPLIVAINKCDLPDANPDRIKQTLSGHDLNPEEWGGDTLYANVSAKTGKGIPELLESILLQAEMLDLKANYEMPARGTVVESRLDKNRGPVATLLVQQGKLATGDIVVSGVSFGKVRALTDSFGKRLNEAMPSTPVEVLGLPGVPNVGDEFFAAADEKIARELTSERENKIKVLAAEALKPKTLEELLAASATGDGKELRLILKADVQGSAEALREALNKLPQEKTKVKILHVGSGGITESDVMLAQASRAVILGFNVRPDLKSQKLAEAQKVQLRTYTIIYDLLEDVKNLMLGLLDAVIKEKVIGRAEVRNVFTVPKGGTIAGSSVIDGKVIRGCFLRLLRDNRVIYEGKITSLRRFKDDVKEVAQGFECGIGLENFNDLKLGDQFEAFIKEEIRQEVLV